MKRPTTLNGVGWKKSNNYLSLVLIILFLINPFVGTTHFFLSVPRNVSLHISYINSLAWLNALLNWNCYRWSYIHPINFSMSSKQMGTTRLQWWLSIMFKWWHLWWAVWGVCLCTRIQWDKLWSRYITFVFHSIIHDHNNPWVRKRCY